MNGKNTFLFEICWNIHSKIERESVPLDISISKWPNYPFVIYNPFLSLMRKKEAFKLQEFFKKYQISMG